MNSIAEVIQFDEAKKLWQKFARQTEAGRLSFELEVHKRLLNFFQVGEFYYYIFNLATAEIELVSESVKTVLGLNSTQDFTTEYVLRQLHPDDLPVFMQFEQQGGDFYRSLPLEKQFKYKMSADYRIKREDGKYIRILHQITPIQISEEGGFIRTLGIHTNISHLKKDNTLSLSMIGLDGEPSYYNIAQVQPGKKPEFIKFTKQEKLILTHLIEGRNSQQIADSLCISKLTVDTHRRNMLKKSNVKSISELTIKYLQGVLG